MELKEYLEKEKALNLEYQIKLSELQGKYLGEKPNHIKFPYNEVKEFPNLESMENLETSDKRGIMKAIDGYLCPSCGAGKSFKRGQTPIKSYHDSEGYGWFELHECIECHQLYTLLNGV